jgi:uncharacterized protein YifE (UPF0438 family)
VGRLSARELARFQVGTPATRLAEERAFLAAHPKPRHFARLGDLALAEDDLDEAIACYQRSVELGPLRPEHVGLDIYLKLLELRCRRLGVARRSTAQRSVDQRGALEVLEQVIRCGASDEQVLAVPGIAALRGLGGLGRFGELLRK